MQGNTDIPILSTSEEGEKDERFEGVILLECGSESKQTAENCGMWWYIRDWELYEVDGQAHWIVRSGHTISKKTIKLLAA